jgi:Reverse transcriptase (RNA-dependent DNA polymerase)
MTDAFEEWTSLPALWDAAGRAARGKRHRESVARVLLELEPTLFELQRQLRAGTWRPGRPGQHVVCDPKVRTITAAPFEDRIVHQALCASVGPMLERGLVGDCFACRTGLGTHAALRRATAWARSYRWYAHLDVRKFFPSIDHALLTAQLARDVACERTLEVCRVIIAAGAPWSGGRHWHFPGDDLFAPAARATGLPIGNLASQHFANRYLSPVDHRARDRLRIRPYLRYMDDLLLFDDDRARLEAHCHDLEERCWRLRLRLHPWQVQPTRAGVSFVGYRILPDHIRVRRSTVRRAEARLREKLAEARRDPAAWPAFFDSLRATFAHWDHAHTWRLRERTLARLGILACELQEEGKR